MCGITGVYHLDRRPVDPQVVLKMSAFQNHRGPDDNGFRLFTLYNDNGSQSAEITDISKEQASRFEGGLGFNRLSILDLSYAGHQPMLNPEGTIIIAFNGEIYNAFDFRDELISLGYQFR